MRIVRKRWMLVIAVSALIWAAGCASSTSAASGDEQAEATASETSSETPEDRAGKTRAIKKRVHFEKILGTSLKPGEKVTGCYGSWDPIDKGRYPGEAFFCSKFNGPKKWGDIPVTFTIQDGELAVIAVQVFYDGPAEARDEYQQFSGNLLDRCSRKTGFERNIVLNCQDYFIDISWQGQQTGQMEVVYALNFDDLPK